MVMRVHCGNVFRALRHCTTCQVSSCSLPYSFGGRLIGVCNVEQLRRKSTKWDDTHIFKDNHANNQDDAKRTPINHLPRITTPTRPLLKKPAARSIVEKDLPTISEDVAPEPFSSPDLLDLEGFNTRGQNHYTKRKNRTPSEHNNYGLHGVSKKKSRGARQDIPSLRGEALFGVFPVLLALQAGRRQIYQLYLKDSKLKRAEHLLESMQDTGATTDDVKNLPEIPENDSRSPCINMEDGVPRTSQTLTSNNSAQIANKAGGDTLLQVVSAARSMGLPITPCSRHVLDSLSMNRPHQGMCMDVSKLPYEICDNLRPGEDEEKLAQLWLVLDSIQDPMNFGAVIRSACYFGVNRIITVNENSCRLSPVVSKASAGALEILPVYGVHNLVEVLKRFSMSGWDVVGTDGKQSDSANDHNITPLQQMTVTRNTIVILGNEGRGMTSDVLSQCTRTLTIPSAGSSVHPHLDSLNVSVAAGVILHHLSTSRRGV